MGLLRKWQLFETLESAWESMSEWFPLSPPLWKNWIEDSVRSGKDNHFVRNLYDRAVEDYLSVSLWEEYLHFLHERQEEFGILEVRSCYERAITSAGIHLSEGIKIWKACIRIEETHLATLIDEEQIEEAKESVRRIYKRAFMVPLNNIEDLEVCYKSWEKNDSKDVLQECADALDKAKKLRSTRKEWEHTLDSGEVEADELLLSNYFSYIQAEEKMGNDPSRVQLLYERAVTSFPITAEIWNSYMRYIQRHLNVPSVVTKICDRAVRNCPWVSVLWSTAIRILDTASCEPVFRQEFWLTFLKFHSHIAPLLGAADFLEILLARCDSCRQQTLEPHELHETFQKMSAMMDEYYPNFVDRGLLLHSYWAECEASSLQDVEAGRAIWESLVNDKYSSIYEAWAGFIDFEKRFGSVDRCRALYNRSYRRRMDDAMHRYTLSHSWLRFERENGTSELYFRALKKVEDYTTMIENYLAKRNRLAEDDDADVGNKRRTSQGKKDTSEKRLKKEPGQREIAEMEIQHDDSQTVFVTNLAFSATESDIREKFSACGEVSDVRIIKSSYTGKPKGYAYVDFAMEESVLRAISLAGTQLLGRTINVQKSNPPTHRRKTSHSSTVSRRRDRSIISTSSAQADSLRLESQPKHGADPGSASLGFVPRAVRGTPSSSSPSEVPAPPLRTNEDFRAMLLDKK